MGVERAVTRWYVQYHMILNEIALLQAQSAPVEATPVEGDSETSPPIDNADLTPQLQQAYERLHRLGPCPKPMMG